MRIPVIFFDNTPGFAAPDALEQLIRSRRIIAFKRSDGWVRVGHDAVRQGKRPFNGPERRRH